MRVLISIAIAGVLALSGCSSNSPKSSAASYSNSDLERLVKAKLATDPDVAAAISVDAEASNNEVKLTGTVPTESLRTRAVDLAKSAKDGLIITDKIDVKPRELSRNDYTEDLARQDRERARTSGDTIGKSIDDSWIHTKITTKLIGNSDTPARKINVDVVDGVVTLRGAVDNQTAKEEAERVAKSTDGVKRVRNLLKVRA
jgi:hyperosmotically inducible periplasmic protein